MLAGFRIDTVTDLKRLQGNMAAAAFRCSMLSVTHTMSLCPDIADSQYSQWFKHPQSRAEYWWRLRVELTGSIMQVSVLVSTHTTRSALRRPITAALAVLRDPVIICAAECRSYRLSGSQEQEQEQQPGQRDGDQAKCGVCKRYQYSGAPLRVDRSWTEYVLWSRLLADGSSPPAITVSLTLLYDGDLQRLLTRESWCAPSAGPAPVPQLNVSLWDNREDADIVLEVRDGKEVLAHKLVLTSCSPVFKAMFAHDTMESREQRVVIPDVDGDVMQEVLRFIYMERVEAASADMSRSLVELAERYELPKLKHLCEQALISFVNPRASRFNAALAEELLPLADIFSLLHLKAVCEVALIWNIYGRNAEYLVLAEECNAHNLRRFAFDRMVSANLFAGGGPGWRQLVLSNPAIVEEMLSAKAQSCLSTPGVLMWSAVYEEEDDFL